LHHAARGHGRARHQDRTTRKGDDTRAWGPPFLEGESAYFLSINRNKESVTLDFKQPEYRAALDGLIAKSDVLVENFARARSRNSA
jgi:crotonobetainyl-CoA:carnitine CoA-transferase CaiB-like acyl-CoA transferase